MVREEESALFSSPYTFVGSTPVLMANCMAKTGETVTQETLSMSMGGLDTVDLTSFPEVGDFQVEIQGVGSDLTVRYVAPSLNIVVTFPWWSYAAEEMRSWTLGDFPAGSTVSPFWDRDQGWNILIWRTGDQVFIAEGDGIFVEGEDGPETFDRWFKVPVEMYESEWLKAIRRLL